MPMKTSGIRLALVACLLIAGFLAACSDDDGELGENGTGSTESTQTPNGDNNLTPETSTGGVQEPPPAPPGFPATDEPPVTTASANGETAEMGIGTYCWTLLCVDKTGVPTRGTLSVAPGDTVTLAIPDDAPPLREASANVFEATNAQTLDDGSEIWPYPGSPGEPLAPEIARDTVEVTVDLEPGQYVLAVSMFFEAGDVTYGVLLEVE